MDLSMNPTTKIENEASAEIENLLEERAGVLAELNRLSAIDGPVQEAESALAAVDRAISTLDQTERTRTEDWAKGGVGDPPEPKTAERRSLVQRRIELESDLAAAQIRSAAVVPRRTELNGDLRRIDHLVFAEKLKLALDEARRLDAEAHRLAIEMRTPIGKVAALKITLMQYDNASGERLIGEAINALNELKMPELGGDPSSLGGFVGEWQDMLR
jgi:hypothetical protein